MWPGYALALVLLQLQFGNSVDEVVEPRFFPAMGLSNFPIMECVVDDLRRGTCLVYADCLSKGGLPAGYCQWDLAACCLFQVTCGGTATYNNTHFVNPAYPTWDGTFGRRECSVTVTIPASTCSLRLRFKEFNLTQPNPQTGVCARDKFIVPKKKGVPVICGENAGQHMYIQLMGERTLKISFRLDTGCIFPRVWNIRIQYILCSNRGTPCVNCLQYHTGVTGVVRSFNFYYLAAPYGADEYWDHVPPNASRLANQNYAICVQQVPGYCAIQWSTGEFDISGNADWPSSEMGDACGRDYVTIPDGNVKGGDVPKNRFCGNILNGVVSNVSTPVTSEFIPFNIRFVSSSRKTTFKPNRGFCLSYQLLECLDNYDYVDYND